MSAPTDTKWGNQIGSGSTCGKIGISFYTTATSDTVTTYISVYYWSKYKLIDNNNTILVGYCPSSELSAMYEKRLNIPLNCTDNTTGWSTDNQILLYSTTKTVSREFYNKVLYFSASITEIENHGGINAKSVCEISVNIPSLSTYFVRYDANGGSGSPSEQTKKSGVVLTLSSVVPTRTGYTFVGWGTSSTDTTVDYYAGGTYSANADITLYAIWKAHTYGVVYNANGGSGSPSSQVKTYGIDLQLSSTIPTRTYHDFLGWGTSSDATTPIYQPNDIYKANASITLYAIWRVNYIQPRISNVSIARTKNGVLDEAGTDVKISFNWETDRAGSRYAVYYKKVTDSVYTLAEGVDMSGTSGTVSTIIKSSGKNVVFSTEYEYDIKLNVADENGYSTKYLFINSLMIPIDCTENGKGMCFGEPATEEEGLLRFAYDKIDIDPKDKLLYKGESFFGGKLLWQGNSLFTDASQITIPSVASQRNGLLFVFARNGDYNFMSYFVPKELIAKVTTASVTFPLCTSLFDYIGQKTLYITDTTVKGHTDNDATGKNATSGITYHNEAFYLRYVYGV